jgi:hypothetical protein
VFVRLTLAVAACCTLLFAAGCTSNGTAFNPPGGGHLTFKHMYISNLSNPAQVYVYDLPVTSSSSPVATVNVGTDPGMLFVDAKGRLFVPEFTNTSTTVQVFQTPLTAASSPAFDLTTSQSDPAAVAEDAAGNVYVADVQFGGYIDVYDGPVNGAASPSYTISNNGVGSSGLKDPYDIAVAPNGDLYASDTKDINQFTPPFSSASLPTASVTPNQNNYGLRVDTQGRVFVADATANGEIDVYTQPFPASGNGLRSFGINVSTRGLYGMAFDGNGNLWTVDGNGVLWEIKAPITASSTAQQVLTGTNGYGIAFGP